MSRKRSILLGAVTVLLGGCLGVPDGIRPVADFETDRYLGTWYEIARLDHRFERGLSRVTATYSRRADGGIEVLNRGYKDSKQRWSQITGRAAPVGDADIGYLKVSFFGPFYASYVVFELSTDYSLAWVTSASRDTLWLLAREPVIPAAERHRFIAGARAAGFNTDELIWVSH